MGTGGYEGVLICIIPPQNGGGTFLPPPPPQLSCVGTRVCTCARPPVSHGHTLRLCPGWVGKLWGSFGGDTPTHHQLGEGNGGVLPPTFSTIPVAPGTRVWSHALGMARRWDGDPPPTEPGAPWCAGWGAHVGGPRSLAWGDPSYAHAGGPQSYLRTRGDPDPAQTGDPDPAHAGGSPPRARRGTPIPQTPGPQPWTHAGPPPPFPTRGGVSSSQPSPAPTEGPTRARSRAWGRVCGTPCAGCAPPRPAGLILSP